MTILVTGFEPFGNQKVNASWEVVSRLPSEINGVRIKTAQIPVVYFESIRAITKILDEHSDITDVIMIGEAGGRTRISVEMIGVNVDDAAIPDNAGVWRVQKRIYESGDDGYFATIPVPEIVEYLAKECNVPAYCSWSAGQFLCNHTLYGMLHTTKEKNPSVRCGFVHLPYTSSQAACSDLPGLPVTEMQRGIVSLLTYLTGIQS